MSCKWAFILVYLSSINILGSFALPPTKTTENDLVKEDLFNPHIRHDPNHIELNEEDLTSLPLDERGFHYIDFHPKPPSSRKSLNPVHVLFKREVHRLCNEDDEWIGRHCDPERGLRGWHDECIRIDDSGYQVEGQCEENEICTPDAKDDDQDDDDITCEPEPTEINTNESTDDILEGVYSYDAQWGGNQGRSLIINLGKGRSNAQISARIEGSDANYPVEPSEPLVARRGTRILCKYIPKLKLCKPTGRFNLKRREKIMFKFGVLSGQAVRLFISIVGHISH